MGGFPSRWSFATDQRRHQRVPTRRGMTYTQLCSCFNVQASDAKRLGISFCTPICLASTPLCRTGSRSLLTKIYLRGEMCYSSQNAFDCHLSDTISFPTSTSRPGLRLAAHVAQKLHEADGVSLPFVIHTYDTYDRVRSISTRGNLDYINGVICPEPLLQCSAPSWTASSGCEPDRPKDCLKGES